jgi:hypothetical protein
MHVERDFDFEAIRKLKRQSEHDISIGGAELARLCARSRSGRRMSAWIARPEYFDAVFDTWVFPLLGLIFLPLTTMMWLFLGAPPEEVQGSTGCGSSAPSLSIATPASAIPILAVWNSRSPIRP